MTVHGQGTAAEREIQTAPPHLGRSALDAVELMSVGVQYLQQPAAVLAEAARVLRPGALLVVSGALVAAYVALWLVGLDLSVRPPLPARFQADGVTGLISLMGEITARLAAFGTLGVLTAIVGFLPKNDDHTLTDEGRRLLRHAE